MKRNLRRLFTSTLVYEKLNFYSRFFLYILNLICYVCEFVNLKEQESRFFFNTRYFEDMVTNGEWDEVEKYLSGFTKVNDNRYSMKIFFEIRKQKYLEALSKQVICGVWLLCYYFPICLLLSHLFCCQLKIEWEKYCRKQVWRNKICTRHNAG